MSMDRGLRLVGVFGLGHLVLAVQAQARLLSKATSVPMRTFCNEWRPLSTYRIWIHMPDGHHISDLCKYRLLESRGNCVPF